MAMACCLDVFDGEVPPPAPAGDGRPVAQRVAVPASALVNLQRDVAADDNEHAKHLAAVLLFRQIANARLPFLRAGAPPSPAAVAELPAGVEALESLKLGKSGGQDQMVNRALAVLSAHAEGGAQRTRGGGESPAPIRQLTDPTRRPLRRRDASLCMVAERARDADF